MKRDLAPFGDSFHETIIENKGFTVWYGLRLGWGMAKKRYNPMHARMAKMGIAPARSVKKTGPRRKVRNIKAFLNRFIRTRFGFLMVAHEQEMAQEIDIILLKVDGSRDADVVERIARCHLREFAKANGWVRDRREGADTWINPEYEWVKEAVRKYRLMARNEKRNED